MDLTVCDITSLCNAPLPLFIWSLGPFNYPILLLGFVLCILYGSREGTTDGSGVAPARNRFERVVESMW
ncbi:hypothetical protein GQ43DRAFT_442622 [Delitschia confertaspora ATCC 74209]|uniref:Uncharacterized protein n=1 Tax=Delitschia confertaspora ATCC 74209 TaxID=1513339 RepID=A0A9P4JM25_9PLEO|nr:hypothetical protein GQ43DRAFT_442622 [Delitschia confertaspora ATCC 74209]